MKRCQFVWLTVRLIYRSMLDVAIALGTSLMLDPLFARASKRWALKIAVRNKTAWNDLLETSVANRIHRVWTHRYQVEGNAKGTGDCPA